MENASHVKPHARLALMLLIIALAAVQAQYISKETVWVIAPQEATMEMEAALHATLDAWLVLDIQNTVNLVLQGNIFSIKIASINALSP